IFGERQRTHRRNTVAAGPAQQPPTQLAPPYRRSRTGFYPGRYAGRSAGALAASAAVDVCSLLARVARLVLLVVSAIIALAILFVVLGANTSNAIVSDFLDWGHTLAGPFVGIFHVSSHK